MCARGNPSRHVRFDRWNAARRRRKRPQLIGKRPNAADIPGTLGTPLDVLRDDLPFVARGGAVDVCIQQKQLGMRWM
jgi:hypothetical protein